jgi:NAD-dependent deacetylase
MTAELDTSLRAALAKPGGLVVLTGAGVSAESGIPTFRGRDGYWTVGSRHYAPQEMATAAMFARHPDAVWDWYLMRRGVCRAARPNAAHAALVELESAFGDRFTLVTQNVDGLHRRAGQSAARTLCVHGDLHHMRCVRGCAPGPVPVPDDVVAHDGAALSCVRCGNWMRPHVLWFDEAYEERHYRSDTAMAAAARAAVFVVVGTSGATSLPAAAAATAARAGAFVVDIDPDDNPFAQLALSTGGVHLRGTAVRHVPDLVSRCVAALG